MSDKALTFEDFVLDDYDFNVYTDWDLMDLWEWVEFDDFSDLEGSGGGNAPPPQHHAPPPAAPPPPSQAPPPSAPSAPPSASSSKVDQIMSDTNSDAGDEDIKPDVSAMMEEFGLDMPPDGNPSAGGMSQSHAADISNDLLADVTAPQNSFDQNFNLDSASTGSDDDFDFNADSSSDFDADFNATTAPPSPHPTQTPSLPHMREALSEEIDGAQGQGSGGGSHSEDATDSDFNFDFDLDDEIPDNIDTAHNEAAPMGASPSATYSETESNNSTMVASESSTAEDTNDDDFDFDFDLDDDTPDDVEMAQSETTSHDDFNFDFDFDDDTPDDIETTSSDTASSQNQDDDDFDFDFNFDDDDGSEFQDFETSASLDLDMTSETDDLSEDDFDFDLGQDETGFGSGGYSEEAAAPPPTAAPSLGTLTADGHARYIETSAGVMDIETDNILAFLQQLEFDEFLETLQLHGHVYDKIMSSDEWSQEEIEFLRSIEPLVKDAEKVAQIREQKAKEAEEAKHRMPDTSGYEDKAPSHYDPRACASLQDMQNLLKEKALSSTLGKKRSITHMPKKLVAEWSKDTHSKKSSRVGKNFSKKLKPAADKKAKAWLKYVPNLPTIKTGKHERYYNELSTMVTTELYAMCGNLDPDSIHFIKEDGERFGAQFTEFLLGKYGTKVLFLYRSQMENDILADKMFEDFHNMFMSSLGLEEPADYTQNFFRAVLSQMQLHNIKI